MAVNQPSMRVEPKGMVGLRSQVSPVKHSKHVPAHAYTHAAIPVLNGTTCTTEVQYKFHSNIKVEWQLDKADPNVVEYEVTAQNEGNVVSRQTREAGIYSVNLPVSSSSLSKGNKLKVFVEAKRQRGENTRSTEHVVHINRGMFWDYKSEVYIESETFINICIMSV